MKKIEWRKESKIEKYTWKMFCHNNTNFSKYSKLGKIGESKKEKRYALPRYQHIWTTFSYTRACITGSGRLDFPIIGNDIPS